MNDDSLLWIPLTDWATPSQRQRIQQIWSQPRLKIVVDLLAQIDVRCLIVGGIVRDVLLNRQSNDIDLVVYCSPERLLALQAYLAEKTGGTAVTLDSDRGTVRLCFSDGDELDLVSIQGQSLSNDLLRRDLTINAITVDSDGALTDPCQGREDLRLGSLRAVREENLSDDPLRVIRCLRFAAQLDFDIDSTTWARMQEAKLLLDRVAGERIQSELRKFFESAGDSQLQRLVDLSLAECLFGLSDSGQKELLLQARGNGVLGFAPGLAIWLGSVGNKKDRTAVFDRLRLARKDQRFVSHWWDALGWLGGRADLSLDQIFELSRVAGPAFLSVASTLQCSVFPSDLSESVKAQVLREAQGQGELNWSALPWNGHQLAESMDRSPGPWLGEALRRIELEWACNRISTLEEARELSRREG